MTPANNHIATCDYWTTHGCLCTCSDLTEEVLMNNDASSRLGVPAQAEYPAIASEAVEAGLLDALTLMQRRAEKAEAEEAHLRGVIADQLGALGQELERPSEVEQLRADLALAQQVLAEEITAAAEERIATSRVNVLDVIRERDALKAKVTEYENALNWQTSCLGCSTSLTTSIGDQTQIDLLAEERDALKAAIERVRSLHRRFRADIAVCDYCDEDFPCATIRALDAPHTPADVTGGDGEASGDGEDSSDVQRFAVDVARLVKDYAHEERGIIALMPFEATLDQLCLEKYGFALDKIAGEAQT